MIADSTKLWDSIPELKIGKWHLCTGWPHIAVRHHMMWQSVSYNEGTETFLSRAIPILSSSPIQTTSETGRHSYLYTLVPHWAIALSVPLNVIDVNFQVKLCQLTANQSRDVAQCGTCAVVHRDAQSCLPHSVSHCAIKFYNTKNRFSAFWKSVCTISSIR